MESSTPKLLAPHARRLTLALGALGVDLPAQLAAARSKTRAERLAANRVMTCEQCNGQSTSSPRIADFSVISAPLLVRFSTEGLRTQLGSVRPLFRGARTEPIGLSLSDIAKATRHSGMVAIGHAVFRLATHHLTDAVQR